MTASTPTRRVPADVRHEWFHEKGTARGVYTCPHCRMWTANVPLYFHDICPKRDRRKGEDRRQSGSDAV